MYPSLLISFLDGSKTLLVAITVESRGGVSIPLGRQPEVASDLRAGAGSLASVRHPLGDRRTDYGHHEARVHRRQPYPCEESRSRLQLVETGPRQPKAGATRRRVTSTWARPV